MSDTEFLIRGKKEIELGKVYLVEEPGDPVKDSRNPVFPLDNKANYIYYSKGGGFIEPELAIDSILTNPIHYGAGGFEGVRVYYSKFGTVFPELENNNIRLMHSTLAFDNLIQQTILSELKKDDVSDVQVTRITPRELYEIGSRCHKNSEKAQLPAIRITKNDGTVEEREIPLRMRAMHEAELKDYTMAEMDTIMKVLAYANKLVSEDYFPEGLEMVNSGYFRPTFWVSGEEGLKVPTGGKPMYYAVATLPWGTYLNEKDYEKGLDVVYAPYPRIDKDMPTDKKIAGNYVNSAINVNLGAQLGYGEILAFKNGRIVEGSAENLFVIHEKENGSYRVFTPPVGDGPLPGTTRDRVIRVLESMPDVELIYESPDKETLESACAVFFTGTGAQIIHMRSVTEDESLADLAKASRLLSEDGNEKELTIKKPKKRTVMINDGKKHPIINQIQKRYEKMILTPQLVRPVYDIDYQVLGNLLGLELKDFTTGEERGIYRGGELRKYTDYLKDVQRKTKITARVVHKAFKKSGLMRQAV